MAMTFNKKYSARTVPAVLAIGIFMGGVFTGCGPVATQGGVNYVDRQETSMPAANNKDEQDKIMKDFQAMIENDVKLPEIIKFVDANISKVSKEKAAKMVDELEKLQQEFLPDIDKRFYSDGTIQAKMSEAFAEGFDLDKIFAIEDEKVKGLLEETKNSGYKVETAEGMFFPVIDYEFYKKYSEYVTEDIREYINIMAVESSSTPAKDAALVIGWDEVLKRASNQEKFINQYKDSVKVDKVRELHRKYLTFTLFGLNNTPLFEYDSKAMDPKAKEAYLKFLEYGNSSEFRTIVKDYMSLLEKSGYKLTDEVVKFRENLVGKSN
ncbi:hypothetical protein JCM21531_2078 [Acetivibrio straminisolvens JCM 21531]|uniref:Lipoprotein n=2 Tax=Acetivibrio straminisolvens TaxID=253314 RepID=W4V731_9FIRM|nr:hypothetical protein JCM21531_2078 [Acetivibrio straminisolvens JCM 21531]